MFRIKYYTILCAVFCFVSCKQNQEIAGSEVDYILFDRILLKNKNSYVFETGDSTKIFYLVRHAEKDTSGNDPLLSEEGMARAEQLDQIFKKTRLDHLYSTLTMRTVMTAQNIASAKGMDIEPYDAKNLADFAEKIMTDPSSRAVLVVGHSNTTPALFELLSGMESPVHVEESDYGYLFIVVHQGAETQDAFYLTF